MASGPAQSDDRTRTRRTRAHAWFAAAPLVLCWISYAVAPAQTFAVPMLAIPGAAILGSRYGTAARWPVAIVLAPMLVSFAIGPAALAGSAGLYFSALLVCRIAGDASVRAAILHTTEPPPPMALGVVLLAMPWFLASPVFAGIQLSIDLWFLVMTLLLITGAGQAPLGPITGWVIGAWLFGLALRSVGLPLSGPFWFVSFNLSSPADLLTALVALHAPRLLRTRLSGTPASTATGLAVSLLAAIFVAALLARVRLVPGMASALGPVAPFALATETTVALIAAIAAFVRPRHWWLAPAVFAIARLPMALVLPQGLAILPVRILGGGLLTALCQTAVIAGFAWIGALAAQLPPSPDPLPRDQGFASVCQPLREEIGLGTRVLLVAILVAVAGLAALLALD